jgi:hypothetical protein
MWQKAAIGLVLGLSFLVLGWWQPGAILLDAPFGLAYFLADLTGRWRPGPFWVNDHKPLALFCFLLWPFLVSILFGCGTAFLAVKLWSGGGGRSRLYAMIFIVMVFGLILAIRVEPGSIRGSYFGYWAENY